MTKLEELRRQLELVFAGYVELDDRDKDVAMDMATLLVRQMVREKGGLRQRLSELGRGKQGAT